MDKVIYVANTDIPSRMANSVQVMKNADAWAEVCRSFTFLTCTTLMKHLRLDPAQIRAFYGLKNTFEIRSFPTHRLLTSRSVFLREWYYRRARRFVMAEAPDLVFTRSYLLPPLMPEDGPPLVVEAHGPPDDNPDKRRLFQTIRRRQATFLLTISDRLRDLYRNAGVPEERIIVLPDGFDAHQFAHPQSREDAAARLNLPTDRVIAGYVGHLYDHRGVEEILLAARALPEILFLIVGGHDADVDRRAREAEALGLTNVRFEGFVSNAQVPSYLWASDILLMPYSANCATADWMSPLKLFEYMAAGRAIICTDLPALRSIVTDGENAIACAPDNSESLTDRLRTLSRDQSLREQLGANARVAVERYSWQNRVRRVIDVLGASR